jgi:hypothetical protein
VGEPYVEGSWTGLWMTGFLRKGLSQARYLLSPELASLGRGSLSKARRPRCQSIKKVENKSTCLIQQKNIYNFK